MNKKSLTILFSASALALVLLLAVVVPNQAKPLLDRETMLRANQLYENGRYSEAVQTYQQLVDQDYTDSSLFYNLGNAHYRRGELGKAILNYERASRLSPRDDDIQENLAYARTQAIDKYETESDSPLAQWTQTASAMMTLNEMAIFTLVLFWILTGLFILYWHSESARFQKIFRYAMVITLMFLSLSLFTLGERVYTERTGPSGIVTVESVEVVSNPGEGGVTQVTLHSGAPVILLETRSQWERLSLPGGQFQGWVPAGTVETVDF